MRRQQQDHVAEVARRRLELLSAELARAGLGAPVLETAAETAAQTAPRTAPDPPSAPVRPPETETEAETEHRSGHEAEPESGPESEPESGLPDAARVPAPGRHLRAARPSPFGMVPSQLAQSRMMLFRGWLRDRTPAALQGRVSLGQGQLTVIAVLAAVAMAVVAFVVLRSGPHGDPVQLPARTAGSPVGSRVESTGGPGTAKSSPSAPSGSAGPAGSSGTVVVDVAGKVRRPGIAVLPSGSRVVDAIKKAGGARHGVNLASLNLARLLVDGEQVLVGAPPGAGAPAGASGPAGRGTGMPVPGQLVNLNTATEDQLDTLPGVGPVTAQAILAWRTEHGGFSSVDELLEVKGIGESTLADLTPLVTV